jgi:hypothetical protein
MLYIVVVPLLAKFGAQATRTVRRVRPHVLDVLSLDQALHKQQRCHERLYAQVTVLQRIIEMLDRLRLPPCRELKRIDWTRLRQFATLSRQLTSLRARKTVDRSSERSTETSQP